MLATGFRNALKELATSVLLSAALVGCPGAPMTDSGTDSGTGNDSRIDTGTPDRTTPPDTMQADTVRPDTNTQDTVRPPDASDPCAALTACDTCTADFRCGFCRTNGRCLAGGGVGSTDGTCTGAAWAYVTSDCTAPDAGPDAACPGGQLLCGAACVDPQSDRNNCGSCARTCGATETCTAGACAPSVCPAPRMMCGAVCVNTASDNANCGSCGRACAGTESCMGGACVPAVVCASPRTMCPGGCVDTTMDALNCGACGTVCASGASCTGSVCACAAGRTACGPVGARACVDTQADRNNCGGCGTVCGGGQNCVSGVCLLSCTLPETRCVAGGMMNCRNVQTDSANCGTCGNVCPGLQVCNAGVCGLTCPAGQNTCTIGGAMTCRNLQTDVTSCGTCTTVCTAGQTCTAGVCTAMPAPPNDNCASASPIVLAAAGTTTTVTGTLVGATDSPGSCSAGGVGSGGDVFYAFTIAEREVVYLDTFGSTPDTVVGFVPGACGTAATNCVDDACGVLQSQTTAVLAAGTYRIVVDVFGSRTPGPITLHIQHFPVGNGPASAITPSATMGNASGTTAGTGTLNGSCGGASSAENTYYFSTCPADAAQLFHATTCGGASWDTLIYQRSNGRAGDACNDDSGFTCGARSSVTAQIPAGANLNAITVDGFGGGSGAYTLQFRYVSCNAGFTNCSGSCLETTRLQSDNANCGACGNVCGAGTSCVTGACRPANDGFANATSLTLTPAELTVTGSTAFATPDGATTCGSAPNVWYRVVLAAREVLYADTAGSAYDTRLSIFNSAGVQVTAGTGETTCSDDAGCTTGGFTAGNQSQVAALLAAGTYYLNVNGFGSAAGSFNLHVQHIAASIGSFFYSTPITGTAVTPMTQLVNTSAYTPGCTAGMSGEDVRWFVSCGGAATPSVFSLCQTDLGSYTRAIGAINFDPAMALRGGLTGTEIACNDDGGATNCQGTGGDTMQYGSRIAATLPRGLAAAIVDERTRANGMQYRMSHIIR